jgi:predicted dehydrogenase
MDSKDVLNIAIAGCHRMLLREKVNHNLAAAIQAVPETKVVAVFDYSEETRDKFMECWKDVWDIESYGDYKKMLKDTHPDIICIATRQTMHADQIELAAQFDVKGVFVDKPFATSMNEVDRIASACQEIPIVMMLERRYMERYKYLRKLIAEDIIGKVLTVVAYGLPNLINHACHWYDTILFLVGDPEPIWVSGFVDDTVDEPADSRKRLDPTGRGQIGLSNDITIYITPDGKRHNFDIIGQKGRLSLFNDAEESYIILYEDKPIRNVSQLRRLTIFEADEPWPSGPAAVMDLVNAIRTQTRSSCDIDQCRKVTEIGLALHASQKVNGAKVMLPLKDRTLRVESYPWGNEICNQK